MHERYGLAAIGMQEHGTSAASLERQKNTHVQTHVDTPTNACTPANQAQMQDTCAHICTYTDAQSV